MPPPWDSPEREPSIKTKHCGLEAIGSIKCVDTLGPPRAGAVSVGVGSMPVLPAWRWCLGEGLVQRPAGKTWNWGNA